MTWQKIENETWASPEGFIIVGGGQCFCLFHTDPSDDSDDSGPISIDDVATLEEAMALAESVDMDKVKEEHRNAAARLAASDQLVQGIKDSLGIPGDAV